MIDLVKKLIKNKVPVYNKITVVTDKNNISRVYYNKNVYKSLLAAIVNEVIIEYTEDSYEQGVIDLIEYITPVFSKFSITEIEKSKNIILSLVKLKKENKLSEDWF